MIAQQGSYAPTVLRGRKRFGGKRQPEPDVLGVYRLVLVVDGMHHFSRDGTTYRCEPGSVYCLQPGAVRDWQASEGSKAELIAFTVMATTLAPAVRFRDAQARIPADPDHIQPDAVSIWGVDLPVMVEADMLSQARDQIRQITHTWWIDDWSHYQANMTLIRFLDEIVRHARMNQEQKSEQTTAQDTVMGSSNWIHQVVTHIETHLASVKTIGELARTFAVSETHLAQTFRKECQETLGAYLRRRRLERAMALIRDTEYSIGAIAGMVGYSSRNILEQSWRRRYDVPPLEWRRRHRI